MYTHTPHVGRTRTVQAYMYTTEQFAEFYLFFLFCRCLRRALENTVHQRSGTGVGEEKKAENRDRHFDKKNGNPLKSGDFTPLLLLRFEDTTLFLGET